MVAGRFGITFSIPNNSAAASANGSERVRQACARRISEGMRPARRYRAAVLRHTPAATALAEQSPLAA